MRSVRVVAAAVLSLLAVSSVALAVEKQGGILRVYHRDSPASASIHEEATYSVNVPFMPVFNNLVIYKQDVAQNSMDSIVPDLAESWAWSGDNKTLNFKLSVLLSLLQAQLSARSGTIESMLFCATSCLYMTRLLKTGMKGMLTE